MCLEGELHTELEDGRQFTLTAGMSYQVGSNAEGHRSFSTTGAKLFVLDYLGGAWFGTTLKPCGSSINGDPLFALRPSLERPMPPITTRLVALFVLCLTLEVPAQTNACPAWRETSVPGRLHLPARPSA